MAQLTAAQTVVLITALREDTPAASGAPVEKGLRAQPRVNRSVLLALARQQDATVLDVKADRDV
jgi:hypothetical protein